MRLVERSERFKIRKARHDLWGQALRRIEIRTAVDDAVANRNDLAPLQVGADFVKNAVQRPRVVDLPYICAEPLVAVVELDPALVGADPLDLTMGEGGAVTGRIDREFDRTGACIQG